jgi:hypothetical protein
MVSEKVYKHCQTLLLNASSKVGRYEALLEFAIQTLKKEEQFHREKVSVYLENRLEEIKNENKKISQL